MLRTMFPSRFFVALLLLCVLSEPARARQFDYGSVRLLLTGEKSGAVFFDLNPPWKTSWRKSTINVFPTELRWHKNSSSFLWPFPQAFDLFGVRSYGYEGRSALPFTTRKPVAEGVRTQARFAVCAQVCLPIETTLTAERATEQERRFIATAQEQVPQEVQLATQEASTEGSTVMLEITYLPVDSSDSTRVSEEQQEEQQEEQRVLLHGKFSNGQRLRNPRLIVERSAALQGGLFEVTSLRGGRTLQFKAEGGLPRDAQNSTVRVLLVADDLPPLTLQATPQLARSPYAYFPSSSLEGSSSLLGLLVLAFLGGLVLNAMPCVFPVLGVKITSFARAEAADRRERLLRKIDNKTGSNASSKLQRALLANALGMMLAFLVLAGVLVLVQSGGEKLGWGFQFHWPVFTGSLAALLLLLTCDGWRIVALPFPTHSAKAPHAKAPYERAQKTTRAKEWSSECVSGMLMTWLATPCAAPVLGSVLSTAIVQQAPVVFLMFALMGAGMAAPLLLAAAYPQRVAKILPPPGAWSEVLRKILATCVFAAAVWLFAIFAKQTSLTAAYTLTAATLLVVFALRRIQRTNARGTPQRRAFATARLAVLLASPIALAATLSLFPPQQSLSQRESAHDTSAFWQPFAPEQIANFLAEENLVVVNITADWCLSCKVNEQRVYKSPAVHTRLEALQPLVLMQADWTSHDARIASFMREHNRYAIPFTALFAPEGEVLLLPELYGKQTFFNALAYAETLRYRYRQTQGKVRKTATKP